MVQDFIFEIFVAFCCCTHQEIQFSSIFMFQNSLNHIEIFCFLKFGGNPIATSWIWYFLGGEAVCQLSSFFSPMKTGLFRFSLFLVLVQENYIFFKNYLSIQVFRCICFEFSKVVFYGSFSLLRFCSYFCMFSFVYLLFPPFFLIELASISTVFPPKNFLVFACSSIFYFKLTSTCFYFYKFFSSASLWFLFPFLIYDAQICYSFRFTVKCVQSAQIVILMWFPQSSFPCLQFIFQRFPQKAHGNKIISYEEVIKDDAAKNYRERKYFEMACHRGGILQRRVKKIVAVNYQKHYFSGSQWSVQNLPA